MGELERLRIGFDRFDYRNDSGNATYSLQLCRTLIQIFPSWEYHLLARIREKYPFPHWIKDAAQVTIHRHLLHPLALGNHLENVVMKRNNRIIRKIAQQLHLFHFTNPLEYVFGLPIPTVVTIHDFIPLDYPQWVSNRAYKFYRDVVPKILEDTTWILANSYFTAQRVLESNPSLEHKITVTPLAASPVFFPRTVPEQYLWSYRVRKPFILYVGSIQHPRKNVEGLLRAYALLRSACPELQLVLIGRLSNPHERQRILRLITDLKLRREVLILEGCTAEEIANFYAAATMFCYPSFVEGFGLPVLEAMQSGCPVITSKGSSLSEIAGDAALLINPADVESIADALYMVYKDSALREKLRTRGFERARQYSWQQTAQKTASVYLRILHSCEHREQGKQEIFSQ